MRGINMQTQLKFKCHHCKEYLSFETDDVFNDRGNESHFNCYVNNKFGKQGNRKVRYTRDEVEVIAREKQREYKIYRYEADKKIFFNWIKVRYKVEYLPKNIITKFEAVFAGTYIGLSKPVCLEHLSEMWHLKEEYLDKLSNENKLKGKELKPIQQIVYDMAVLLNKYDRYIEWKKKN
jgi:hypothetical protein